MIVQLAESPQTFGADGRRRGRHPALELCVGGRDVLCGRGGDLDGGRRGEERRALGLVTAVDEALEDRGPGAASSIVISFGGGAHCRGEGKWGRETTQFETGLLLVWMDGKTMLSPLLRVECWAGKLKLA